MEPHQSDAYTVNLAADAHRGSSPDEVEECVTNTQIPYIVHNADDDNDSGLGDDTSIVVHLSHGQHFEYRALHGRTYQISNSTEYWGPNDEEQNEGLDLAHALITMLLGDRVFEAPMPRPPTKVLDVGTDTGIWSIDMADAYPAASIIGTDISPIQPSWVPPNCNFYIEDVQLDWTFERASFDFVHIRALYGSISDWGRLYEQAYEALVPDGWVEDFEFTVHLHSDAPHVRDDPQHIFKRWATVFYEAADRLNRTLRIGNNGTIRRLLQDAGFEDVQQKYYQVPVGGWSSDPVYRKIGIYNLAFMEQSLEGFALFLLREIMGWQYERVQLLLMEMRSEIRNQDSSILSHD